ncbi:MAG: hypothetical protein ACRCYU_12195 [Nocardioides sp.]
MSTTATTPKTDEQPPAAPPVDPPATNDAPPDGEQPKGEAEAGKGGKDNELPEWARGELSSVRGEAAKYRTALREAQQKLEAAKTPEEFESATKGLTGRVAELEREILVRDIAASHGIPPALATRLHGASKEELEKDAKELQKLVAVQREPESLGGGLDPSSETEEFDPEAVVRNLRANRY